MMFYNNQAFKALFQRYWQVFRVSWTVRKEMDHPEKEAYELAFLPAHLELIETPVHPAPRWTMRLIILFIILALLWAFFGELDVVAVAQGKLVPNARVKVVQSLEPGVVKNIRVMEGQRVTKGQLLIELDPTQTGADLKKANEARLTASLTVARSQALLEALNTGKTPQLSAPADVPSEELRQTLQLTIGMWNEYLGKMNTLQAELQQRKAEQATAEQVVVKLSQTAPLAHQQAENYKRLAEQNYITKEGYLEKEQRRIELERDLVAQQSRVRELVAAIQAKSAQIDGLQKEFRRQILEQLNQANQQLAQFKEEANKAQQKQQLTQLRAPESGTVQQLVTHTVGGVVTAAQPLLVVVPDDTLEVEAFIENKDIGFVQPGQQAIVKLETFPYTKYGYLVGKVISVSSDAIQDEKRGLIFLARIQLPTNRLRVEQKWVKLSPGMLVSAEVKTGQRRVIEYFLSPVLQHGNEALRER